jgi:hypothetical protein
MKLPLHAFEWEHGGSVSQSDRVTTVVAAVTWRLLDLRR